MFHFLENRKKPVGKIGLDDLENPQPEEKPGEQDLVGLIVLHPFGIKPEADEKQHPSRKHTQIRPFRDELERFEECLLGLGQMIHLPPLLKEVFVSRRGKRKA
jgi:hypothetical protein